MFIFDQANKPTTWGLFMNGTEPQPYHMQAKVEKLRKLWNKIFFNYYQQIEKDEK